MKGIRHRTTRPKNQVIGQKVAQPKASSFVPDYIAKPLQAEQPETKW